MKKATTTTTTYAHSSTTTITFCKATFSFAYTNSAFHMKNIVIKRPAAAGESKQGKTRYCKSH